MTARRFNTSPTVSPARTGGDDQPRGNCEGDWLPFDILIDGTKGVGRTYAIREAAQMCSTCPLRSSCLTQNAEEDWAVAVVDGLRALRRAETDDAA